MEGSVTKSPRSVPNRFLSVSTSICSCKYSTMIVELCLILRIVFNENQHFTFQGVTVETCEFLTFCLFYSPVLLQTTKSSKDAQNLVSTKMPIIDYIPPSDSWNTNSGLNSLWVYRPASLQSNPSDMSRHVVFKPPHLLTRLTKPLTFGFDPFFNKGYFEPFETRQKPVTLVTFRKNGHLPRQAIAGDEKKLTSDEVAEMQSPFNDISSFWDDIPGLINI